MNSKLLDALAYLIEETKNSPSPEIQDARQILQDYLNTFDN